MLQAAVKTDPKQPFIDYLNKTNGDPHPWSDHGENWTTGEGLEPVEFPLLPRWDDPGREAPKGTKTT